MPPEETKQQDVQEDVAQPVTETEELPHEAPAPQVPQPVQHFTVSGGPETLIEIQQKEAATEVLFPERVVHKEDLTVAPVSAKGNVIHGTTVNSNTQTHQNKETDDYEEPKSVQFAKSVFKKILLAFVISMFGGLLGPIAYIWYVPAIAAIIFPAIFFVWGIFTPKKGGIQLAGLSILFFIIAVLVGTGTCFANMALMSWVGGLHF